jgi:hypothetical protein
VRHGAAFLLPALLANQAAWEEVPANRGRKIAVRDLLPSLDIRVTGGYCGRVVCRE